MAEIDERIRHQNEGESCYEPPVAHVLQSITGIYIQSSDASTHFNDVTYVRRVHQGFGNTVSMASGSLGFNEYGDPKSSTVIDPAKGTVIATIPLGGAPEQAVADGKGMIYDNLEDTNEVIALDSRTLKIQSRWKVTPAGQPVSMAMDRQSRRLFIGGRNPKLLVVMDADSGKIIGEPFPIGDRVDANIFDPETQFVASSTREGTIHIIHEDSPNKFSVVDTVKTEFGAKTMGLDSKTHNLLVDTSDFEIPAAAAQQSNPQPRAKPGTFRLLIYGR
jgi:hypothetical protein